MYSVAERFLSIQGEGLYTGVPMAFIRFVGCSVSKSVCNHCDTDFKAEYPWHGGGTFSAAYLGGWVTQNGFRHVCLTGGEPLDQDLEPLIADLWSRNIHVHIETSGTKTPPYIRGDALHICVSPKPGYKEEIIDVFASEVKVIVPGLGKGEGWPTPEHALTWAKAGKLVYLQPRNAKWELDRNNLALCEELVRQHPILRLSVQMHKLLRVR